MRVIEKHCIKVIGILVCKFCLQRKGWEHKFNCQIYKEK